MSERRGSDASERDEAGEHRQRELRRERAQTGAVLIARAGGGS